MLYVSFFNTGLLPKYQYIWQNKKRLKIDNKLEYNNKRVDLKVNINCVTLILYGKNIFWYPLAKSNITF